MGATKKFELLHSGWSMELLYCKRAVVIHIVRGIETVIVFLD